MTSLPCSLRQADGRRSTRAAARAAARVAAEQNPRPDSGQPAKKDSNIRGNKEHASPILLGLAMAAAAADAIMPVARVSGVRTLAHTDTSGGTAAHPLGLRKLVTLVQLSAGLALQGLASAVVSGMAAGSTVGGTVVMRRDEGSSTASPALSARQAGTWPPSPAAVQGAQVLAASRLGGAGRQLHVATARAGTASAAVGSASEQSALHHTEPEADQAAASISPAPGAPVALPVVPSRTTLRVLSGGSAAPPAAAADEPAAAAPSNAAPKATPSSAPAAAAPSTTPAATMPGRTPLEVVPTAPSTLPDVPAPEGPTSSITGGNGGMLEGLLQTLAAAAADAKASQLHPHAARRPVPAQSLPLRQARRACNLRRPPASACRATAALTPCVPCWPPPLPLASPAPILLAAWCAAWRRQRRGTAATCLCWHAPCWRWVGKWKGGAWWTGCGGRMACFGAGALVAAERLVLITPYRCGSLACVQRALEGGHLAPAGSSLPATAAAPVPAAASSVPSTAGASGGAATGGSGGGSGKYDELLKALAAAAASSDLEVGMAGPARRVYRTMSLL